MKKKSGAPEVATRRLNFLSLSRIRAKNKKYFSLIIVNWPPLAFGLRWARQIKFADRFLIGLKVLFLFSFKYFLA